MLKFFFILISFLFFVNTANAFDFFQLISPYLAPHKDQIYPIVEKYIGQSWAIKLFPSTADLGDVVMPPIPVVTMDATSTKSYEEKEVSKLSKENEEKYNYAFIVELYQVVRGNSPTQEELGGWMNALLQGGTREGVYRGLVLNANYAGLENFNQTPSENSIKFAQAFLKLFIGQTVSEKAIKEFNFYSLKRVCAEKALEILDEYGANKEHRSSWYAVLSSEMAEKYPNAFRSEIRKDKNANRHKHWAMNVPVQHVKSEVVIKIHTLFNYLK